MAVDSTDSFHGWYDQLATWLILPMKMIPAPSWIFAIPTTHLITLIRDTIIKCDSCNDSVIATVEVLDGCSAGYRFWSWQVAIFHDRFDTEIRGGIASIWMARPLVVNKDSTLLDNVWTTDDSECTDRDYEQDGEVQLFLRPLLCVVSAK